MTPPNSNLLLLMNWVMVIFRSFFTLGLWASVCSIISENVSTSRTSGDEGLNDRGLNPSEDDSLVLDTLLLSL